MRTGNEIAKLLLLLTGFAICSGCDNSDKHLTDYSLMQPEPDTNNPITVSVGVEGATRASDPITIATLTSFDVSAVWNFNALPEHKWYMKQQVVTKPSTAWVTTPMSYWTVSGNLSFFMYAPSANGTNGITPVYPTTGMPSIVYTPNAGDVNNMPDLCIARPVLNATKEIGAVPATFYHALSQIWFELNYTGNPPAGFTVKVESIKLCNIVGTGTATYTVTAPYFEWSGGAADAEYEITRAAGQLRDITLPKVPDAEVLMQNSLGALFLVPQTPGPTAELEVTYSFFDGATRKATFTKTVSLPTSVEWPANRAIHYKATLDVGESSPITFTGCVIEGWTGSGSSHTEITFD